MKKAVAYLQPYLEAEKDGKNRSAGKILMATVKGDVHDIGKNIVGIVLQCNNYEVIDMGVMIPADKILKKAIEMDVDMIGLSGLITPSLDEMVYLAKEMERQQFAIPLLIGGATTSKAHTAVKIDSQYKNAVVHVNDASRAVTVVGDLLNKKTSPSYVAAMKKDYDVFREKFLKRGKTKEYISIIEARKRKYQIDWSKTTISKPKELGVQVLNQMSLKELVPYIDWSPFFRSWDLHGRYPDILTDTIVGKQATHLFEDAQVMIKEIIAKQSLKPKAIFGLFEANAIHDDDIVIQKKGKEIAVFRTLRQQLSKREGVPNLALADFVAPKDTGFTDYMGAFCVAIFGAQELATSYKEKEDDYNAIMVQAIADRFAEAFAEYLHKQIRTKHWGYTSDENLSNEDLIKESYKGIRPAPGYPACPDHLEKLTIWKLLNVEENTGITLTESLMHSPVPILNMSPTEVAAFIFTSGTAGSPKAAMLTHNNLHSNLVQLSAENVLHSSDVVYGVLPLFHIFGLNVVLGYTLFAGASVVLVQRFDPSTALETFAERGVTVVPGAPQVWSALAQMPEDECKVLSQLRVALTGAAKMPEQVTNQLKDRYGLIVHEGYGLTESSPVVTTSVNGDHKVGSIGKPLQGVSIRLVDEHGDDAEEGDSGEIWVHGENVFAGYYNDHEATDRVLTSDGWLRTGDAAYCDDEGFFYIHDRYKDMIVSGGENIYPTEVENILYEHPDVAETAVIGVPHPRWGETPKAIVVCKPGQTIEAAALLDFTRARLARYKCPTSVEVVEQMPRNASGKILKRELRAMIWPEK